jgi:hypothetical protein
VSFSNYLHRNNQVCDIDNMAGKWRSTNQQFSYKTMPKCHSHQIFSQIIKTTKLALSIILKATKTTTLKKTSFSSMRTSKKTAEKC